MLNSAGKRGRASSPSATPEKDSTPKKARDHVRNLLDDWSSEEWSPEGAARCLQHDPMEGNASDLGCDPLDLSIVSVNEEQQQQQQDEDQEWTIITRGRVRHQQPPRPKFKLGILGDHDSAYQAITALEREQPSLRMEVRPNLQKEYVLTHRDEE